jgi:hypothetical protein
VDERSKLFVKDDWDANYWLMYWVRDQAAKTGAAVGYYTLDDFIAGLAPPCRAYVFANAFRLDEGQVGAILARLDKERATAIWDYGAGCLGRRGLDLAQMARLTGMTVAAAPGRMDTVGEGLLRGLAWGPGISVAPRFTVTDGAARVLGRYRDGGAVSAAEKRHGPHRSVLLADWGPTAQVLRRLLRGAGCHLWAPAGDVVLADGRFLAVHSGASGRKRLSLPAGCSAEPLGPCDVVERRADGLTVRCRAGDTLWFRLRR